MASVRLAVTGMTCDHCVAKVEQALKGVAGVWGAFVDLARGSAEVDFDDARVQTAALVEAVKAAGYDAQVSD
jgi:copper ion binding protein